MNSVNFSTCLHRLARLANAPPSKDGVRYDHAELRRGILSDPRFAILVCGLCEAVAGIDPDSSEARSCGTAAAASSAAAGGGESVVGGWETGLDVTALNRMRGGDGWHRFSLREFSNIAWAVAKLRIAPPGDAFPVVRPSPVLGVGKGDVDDGGDDNDNGDKSDDGDGEERKGTKIESEI